MSNAKYVTIPVPTVDIDEAARLIEVIGKNVTVLLLSEPGVGKTSVLRLRAIRNGDKWRNPGDYFPEDKYQYVYVDGGNLRENDLAIYMPDRETKRVEQYVTSLIDWDDKRPVIMMIDEVLKIPKLSKPLVTRLILERCVGDRRLNPDSELFCTSNNASDGVNDSIEAHVGNRLCIVQMRKPTARKWLVWASENGISALTRTYIALHPSSMASYKDGDQSNNGDIFNPRSTNLSFGSPRSYAQNDYIVRNWRVLGLDVAKAAMMGTIGASAGEKMAAFLSLEDDALAPKDILADPENVKIPEKPAALFMSTFNLIDAVETQDDMTAAMKFVKRSTGRELQSVFVQMLFDGKLAKIAKNNSLVTQFIRENPELLRD